MSICEIAISKFYANSKYNKIDMGKKNNTNSPVSRLSWTELRPVRSLSSGDLKTQIIS